VYVDIAGWHLFLRDMSAVPGLKMSQALATQLGPEVRAEAWWSWEHQVVLVVLHSTICMACLRFALVVHARLPIMEAP